jgi:hypothetical protein
MAPGPVSPAALLIAPLDVEGMQNSEAVVGLEVSAWQVAGAAQSALLVQGASLLMSPPTQWLPTGEATPVRVMVPSKQGVCTMLQVPAPWVAHSASFEQARKVLSVQVPWVLSWHSSLTSFPQNPTVQPLGLAWAALAGTEPVPCMQVLPPSEHWPSLKQGWSGSPCGAAAVAQKPQWQKNPQVDLAFTAWHSESCEQAMAKL